MAKEQVSVETRPYVLSINQIEPIEGYVETPKATLNKVAEQLKEKKLNSVLPIACLTAQDDKYHLLTGLSIYEAAKLANLKEIWVFLIAEPRPKAEQWLEQTLLLTKLNETVIEPQDIPDFLKFINDKHAELTSVTGIGTKTAQKIIDNRPYNSLEELQKKLGAKRPLNWLRNFKRR